MRYIDKTDNKNVVRDFGSLLVTLRFFFKVVDYILGVRSGGEDSSGWSLKKTKQTKTKKAVLDCDSCKQPHLTSGRPFIEKVGLFIGFISFHFHHNVVVHLTAGAAQETRHDELMGWQ